MVECFEQYLKVATLKETAERMQGKSLNSAEELNGALVPSSVASKSKGELFVDLNLTSQPIIPSNSKL